MVAEKWTSLEFKNYLHVILMLCEMYIVSLVGFCYSYDNLFDPTNIKGPGGLVVGRPLDKTTVPVQQSIKISRTLQLIDPRTSS